MTELEQARAALERSREAKARADQRTTVVGQVVGSLTDQLEANGFSGRWARWFGLEDPHK
jgi:hypothetical protein